MGSANVPMLLTFALAGFGLSLGNRFRTIGIISTSVTKFTKIGGWMNTVKVVLGFVELALALKFYQKADLVSKTFLLKRELFIAIWIIITIGLVFYLEKSDFHMMIKPKNFCYRKIFGVLGIGF